MAERTSAASPANPRNPPTEASRHADPSDGAVSPDAHASRPASAVLSEPRPAARSGSFGSGVSAPPPKAHVDPELDRGHADQPRSGTPLASAAPPVRADAASLGATPALAAFSLSDSATQPAEAVSQTRAPMAPTSPAADKVREIDLDLAPGGLKDVTMTVRLTGDKLGVVVRAASGETAATIEGARDAIAERLAAIGQPVTSLIIQQTGASDAKGATGQSAGDGDGGAPQGQGREAGDPRGSRRGASRF